MDEVDAKRDLVPRFVSSSHLLKGHKVALLEIKEDSLGAWCSPNCESGLLVQYSLPTYCTKEGILRWMGSRVVISGQGDRKEYVILSAAPVRNSKVARGRKQHILLESVDGDAVQ